MASSNSSSKSKNAGKGAAEEPEPPDGSLSSTTTASYDPTIYQRPHPNDRGGGGGGDGSKPSKKKGEGDKAQAQGKSTGKSKGALSLDFCGNCGAEGELRKCKQCGAVAYCGEACQRVSAMAGWRAGMRTPLGEPCEPRSAHGAHVLTLYPLCSRGPVA